MPLGAPLVTLSRRSEIFVLIGECLAVLAVKHLSWIRFDEDPEAWSFYARISTASKRVITLRVTVGERTTEFETYFMPHPEENVAETLEYLLRCGVKTYPYHFVIGVEDAVYLRSAIDTSLIDEVVLDLYLGAAVHYSESYFPVAMSIGFPSRYRYSPNQ